MTMIAQPGKVTSLLVLMAVCLILASLSGSFANHLLHDDCIHGLVPLFDLDGERNIPSLFSTLVILLCAFFLFMIGACHANGRKNSSQWLGLAALFVYLAADELVSLHERLTEPLRAALHTSGIFYFA
ncbi:MAG TPA: hypothetical protein VLU73_14475 [Methylococcaceae bacterium]|nr:hypothetical protein [Methylococcaceae bacterium]